MKLLLRVVDGIVGAWVRRTGCVSLGIGSRVRWWGLRRTARGRVHIGAGSIVRCRIDFDHPGAAIHIGDRCFLGASQLVCHTSITIGNDVIMSWGVTVVDHDSHSLQWKHRQHDVAAWMLGEKNWKGVSIAPVVIEDRAWIGFGASILKGVRIGEGSVVGANSVVTRNVPPYSVVAGSPARVVRQLDQELTTA